MSKFVSLPKNYNDEKEQKKLERINSYARSKLDENKNVIFSHYETPDGHRLNDAEIQHLLRTGTFRRMVNKDA